MVQWLKAHTSLTEDLNLVPSTHVGQFTTACDSSSQGANTSSVPSGTALISTNTNTDTNIITQLKEKNNFLKGGAVEITREDGTGAQGELFSNCDPLMSHPLCASCGNGTEKSSL